MYLKHHHSAEIQLFHLAALAFDPLWQLTSTLTRGYVHMESRRVPPVIGA